MWLTNVVGTERVVHAVADEQVPIFVHASSVGTYSPRHDLERIDESFPTTGIPELGYSWEKGYAERLLDGFEERAPSTRVVRLRPALIFKRSAAHHVQELFLGPFVPRQLLRPGMAATLARRVPLPFQVVHTGDVATAYRLALFAGVRGAFNIATEPVLGTERSGSQALVKAGRPLVTAGWKARLLRSEPGWLTLASRAPIMSTDRARAELGWAPKYDAVATLAELLGGLRDGATGPTPALGGAR
jgi:nucleoside-diphosphate-sugar epimerase